MIEKKKNDGNNFSVIVTILQPMNRRVYSSLDFFRALSSGITKKIQQFEFSQFEDKFHSSKIMEQNLSCCKEICKAI
jgi:hypothetical protein